MPLTNVDGLLTNVEAGVEVAPREIAPVVNETPDDSSNNNDYSTGTNEEVVSSEQLTETPADDSVDDYGNPKPESKMYTEEEVNERINKAIRDRLQRGNNQQQQQPVQAAQQDFKYDESSDQSWEAQLETFVERTLEKVGQKQQAKALENKEAAIQAEFETKIHSGMSKFSDFVEVVGSKPITDAMTIATRSMKDPAAFLYAAAKTQAAELERISKIPDAYAQIAEIGRLEERMRKTKNATNAPKPLNKTAGDMSDKAANRSNVDDKIRQHAKTKYTR